MVPWAHPSQPHKRHLDRFSRFCRAHERDQQTDRHTDRPQYTVYSNRPHLPIAAMRPKIQCILSSLSTYKTLFPNWRIPESALRFQRSLVTLPIHDFNRQWQLLMSLKAVKHVAVARHTAVDQRPPWIYIDRRHIDAIKHV